MKNIAILTGGDSSEYDISIKSAYTIKKHLSRKLFKGYIICLRENEFSVIDSQNEYIINKDFTLSLKDELITFDAVFMALHGSPAENGLIQPYFDKLKIPYTSCDGFVSSLVFDKYRCNKKLNTFNFRCPESLLYHKGETIDHNTIINKMKLPFFVKPNSAGSSLGISKVKKKSDLFNAINYALKHDQKVIIQKFIDGTEISVGVYNNDNIIEALPITEIITDNEFFDYQAKYEGKAQEITPAQISNELKEEIKKTTINIYKKMGLRGICRIDYIINKDNAFVIEINTIPGFTLESIILKQIEAAGLKLSEVFETCLLTSK